MADCKNVTPQVCGVHLLKFPSVSCADAPHFEGITNITVNQGDDIDLTDGVHAYDGNGFEIPYEVSPDTIDPCASGQFTVKYTAVGSGEGMRPTFPDCVDTANHLPCEGAETEVTAYRTVTIRSIGQPTISLESTSMSVRANQQFNPLNGASAKDGRGNVLPVTYSGDGYLVSGDEIYYPTNGTYTLTYSAEDACGNEATATVNIEVWGGISPTCFIKGTKVWTEKGLVNIEDIAVGDNVLSYNDLTEDTELGEVTNVITDNATAVYAISVGGEVISVTGEHRMYLPTEDGYKAVKDLKVGDELLKVDGSHVAIDGIEEVNNEYTVHNLEINRFSNYFVGEGGYLSYNMNISGVIQLSPKSFRSSNGTHSFNVKCQQIRSDRYMLDHVFRYEIAPAQSGVPPLNYSDSRGIFTFSLVGTTEQELNLSVDISEDGDYEYSVTPVSESTPCKSASENYEIGFRISDGEMIYLTIWRDEQGGGKVNYMEFHPLCVNPEPEI